MFNEEIRPVEPLKESYWQGNYRLRNEPDYSLSCLGVALLDNRIEGYRGIDGEYYMSSFYFRNFAQSFEDMDEMFTRYNAEQTLTHPYLRYDIISFAEKTKEALRERFEKRGAIELQNLEMLIKQNFNLDNFMAFTEEEHNTAYIFSSRSDNAIYHTVCSCLPKLFPAMFKNKPLTQDELYLIKAMFNKTPTKFVELLGKALEPMKEKLAFNELEKLFKEFRIRRLNNAAESVRRFESEMKIALETYSSTVEMYNSALITYEGLKITEGRTNERDSEIVEYLSKNKNIHNLKFENGKLSFDVTTLLLNIDTNKYAIAVNQRHIFDNYTLDRNNPFIDVNARKMLMNALFASQDPELFVNIRGHIVLEPNRNKMTPIMDYYLSDEKNPEIRKCLTNPHFNIHGCPGLNRGEVTSCLASGDLIAAIECCVAATGGINITETEYTFKPFINDLLNSTEKVIHRADGVDMTPEEALMYLTRKEKECEN